MVVDGFVFYKDKDSDDKTYWKCSLCHKNKCQARISTSEDKILTRTKDHNHSGNAALLEANDFVNIMKDQAVKSLDAPHKILSKISELIPSQVAPQLPTTTSMKKTIRHTRNKENELPPCTPTTAAELVLPDEFKVTHKKESFVLFDNEDEERVIIFGTLQNLNLLTKSKHWYVTK